LNQSLVAADREFAGQQITYGIQSKQTLSGEQVAVAYGSETQTRSLCGLANKTTTTTICSKRYRIGEVNSQRRKPVLGSKHTFRSVPTLFALA
jgi:hypothetical protein